MPVTLTLEVKNSGTVIAIGQPIGLLLALTYAAESNTNNPITLETKH